MIISNFTFSKLKFLHPHLAKFQISVGVNTIHPIVQYLKPVLPLPFFSYTVVNLSNPTSYTCRIYFKPDHFLPPSLSLLVHPTTIVFSLDCCNTSNRSPSFISGSLASIFHKTSRRILLELKKVWVIFLLRTQKCFPISHRTKPKSS